MLTSHDRPRLREDLVAEAIEDQGARFIDVIDPDTGNAYRFYDVEYSLACAMDGERDLPGLVRWAQEELGIAPSASELKSVISTLGDLGYLDTKAREPGLMPGVTAAPVAAPASGIEVELGHFRAEPIAAPAEPAVELELGAAGPRGAGAVEVAGPELPLGPAGVLVPELPLPLPVAKAEPAHAVPARAGSTTRPGTDAPRAAESGRPGSSPSVSRSRTADLRPSSPTLRPSEAQLRAEPPRRASEPVLAPTPARASEPKVAQPPARASEPRTQQPFRTSEPRLRPSAPALSASDPSVNLSLPIRPDDVKEAVRASREMRSVDVPADLMQALESAELGTRAPTPPAPAPVAPAPLLPSSRTSSPAVAPRPVESARTSSAMPTAAVLDPIAPLSGTPLSMSEPISPPSVPPLVPVPPLAQALRVEYPRAEARPALAPAPREPSGPIATPVPQPARRSNTLIVALLLLAILGVVGFGVWKFVLNKEPAPRAPDRPVSTVPTAPVDVAPAAPPPITAKLSLIKPPPVAVKMGSAGVLQSIIADGTQVHEGDPVARLAGGKAQEQKVIEIKGDLDKRYPADIKRLETAIAAAAGNNGALARLQAELTNRKNRVAQRTEELKGVEAELAKLALLAKASGKVTVVAKIGARLAPEADVVTIEPDGYLSGAADLGKPVAAKAGDPIELQAKGGASAKCTLETVQGNMVSFRCPIADGFADGVEVELTPAAEAPAPAPAPAAPAPAAPAGADPEPAAPAPVAPAPAAPAPAR